MEAATIAGYKKKIEELQLAVEKRRLVVQKLKQNIHKQNFNQLTTDLNVTQPIKIVVPDVDCAGEQDLHQNINKFVDGDILFSSIDFNVDEKEVIGDSISYLVTGKSGPVAFQLGFNYCKTRQHVNKAHLTVHDAAQQLELAPCVNQFMRENNVQRVTRTIREYSVLFVARETVLKILSKMHPTYFQYLQYSDTEGITIQIANQKTGLQYLSAKWTVKWFKARFSMDHAFVIDIYNDAAELGKEQKDQLQQLVTEEHLTDKQLLQMFQQLIVAFKSYADA